MITPPQKILYTIGHSTRTAEEFLSLLQRNGVQHLVDVRKIPRSRRHPQFVREAMAEWLPAAGVAYTWMGKEFGGFRKPQPDSRNTAWRNESFRGYADYMQTEEFTAAVDTLEKIAAKMPTAIMCAEAVPWQCHRSFISDAMLARGWVVLEIISDAAPKARKLPDFARVDGTRVTYPLVVRSLFEER